MLALRIAQGRTIPDDEYKMLVKELSKLPSRITKILSENEAKICEIAKVYR